MSEEKEFGVFGTGEPVTVRRFSARKALKWTAVLLLLAFIPFAVRGWLDFYDGFGESVAPKIEIIKPPAGLGLEPLDLHIKVVDQHAGLDQVIVRAEQGRDLKELLKKDYPVKVNDEVVALTIPGKESGFREGDLRITVIAFDRSLWSNSAKVSFLMRVDYQRPHIEVVSTQHNAVRGGVELVFYRIPGDPAIFSGVMAGPDLFPGFPAAKLDKDFEPVPDLYFALFAVPLDFNEAENELQIFARDTAGNSSAASFFYRIKEWRAPDMIVEVPRSFLQQTVPLLYTSYLKLSGASSDTAPTSGAETAEEDLIEELRAILKDYSVLLSDSLKPIFSRPKSEKLWQGYFIRPAGRQTAVPFGAAKEYYFESLPLGRLTQAGIDFAAAPGTAVRAANGGIVIFADDSGLYGKTVAIDHGFGLTTLYTHLDTVTQLEGTRVAPGDVIGTSGSSGLAWKPAIGYQVRLHGVPVRPEEWWDRTWIADHIEAKVQEMKKRLGIQTKMPLE